MTDVWDKVSLTKMEVQAKEHAIDIVLLQESFAKEYAVLRERYPDKDEQFYQQRARFAVKSLIVDPIARSPSKAIRVYWLGYGAVRDIWVGKKQDALAAYKKNAEQAVNNYLVKVEMGDDGKEIVIPLDVNETFKNGRSNPNFRKPLPYSPQFNAIGIGYPLHPPHVERVENAKQSLLKFVNLRVGKYILDKRTGEPRVNNPEDWVPLVHQTSEVFVNTRRPVEKSLENPIMYLFNDAADLREKEVPTDTFSKKITFDANLPWITMTKAPEDVQAEISELPEWIENHSKDYDMFVITRGWVSNINHQLEENQDNYLVEIQDMAENSVSAWVHKGIYPLIEDVGRRTEIGIIGWPRKTEDATTGEVRVSITAWAIALNPDEFYSKAEDPREQAKEAEAKEEVKAEE